MLLCLLSGCSDRDDDDEWWKEQQETEDPPTPLPSIAGLQAASACARAYVARFPALLDELRSGEGTILLDWPGGYVVELTITRLSPREVVFSNDPGRDGYRFAGTATIDGSRFTNGTVEIRRMGCVDLCFGEWAIDFAGPYRGSLEVNPEEGRNLKGGVIFSGDGTALFSGGYRELHTASVPVQFEVPVD